MPVLRNANPSLKGKIEIGYFFSQEEEGEDYYKLIPSEGDRDNFGIIDETGKLKHCKLQYTFDYFTKELNDTKGLDSKN